MNFTSRHSVLLDALVFLLVGASAASAQTPQVRIDSVTPASAPVTRHTEVEIRGEGFTPEMMVAFGRMWAWRTEYVSGGVLRVVTPISLRPGTVSIGIRVENQDFTPTGNTSFVLEPDATYEAMREALRARSQADWERVESIYRGVLDAEVPDNDMRSFVMTQLAWVLITRGNLEEAEQISWEALKLFYQYGLTHGALATALYWQGKLPQAAKSINTAVGLRMRPGSEQEFARVQALFAYYGEETTGGKEESRRSQVPEMLLSRAKEQAPNDPLVLLLSGIVNCRRGRLAEGMEELEKALPQIHVGKWGFSPGFAHAALGEAYWLRNQSGDRGEAERLWREAGRLDPILGQKFFNVARGHLRLGQWKRGRLFLVQALAMQPEGSFAERAREILRQTEGWE